MPRIGNSITVGDYPFMGAFFCVFITFIFYLISFSSPYWLHSYPNVYNPFIRTGLWSVCYSNYINPKDYKNNRFSGCFWIFSLIFHTTGMWEYVNPRWMVAVQVLFTIGFILQCLAVICVSLYLLLYGQPVIESTIALYSQIGAVIFSLVSVIIFGVKSQDRTWMHRPDHNFFGFSYAFVFLVIFYGLLATFFLVLVNQGDRYLKVKHERDEINDFEQNKSRMTYGGRSTQFHAPASYFAGTGVNKQPLILPSNAASELSSEHAI